jgi:nucleoside-diphosphate-sugar epimerase
MNNLSIFGGHGFILGRYAEMFGGYVEGRNYIVPKYPNILYGISTTDNYHIFTEPYKDIDTNLTHLVMVLEEAKKKFDKNFVFNFLSSWFVYDTKEIPAKETSPCAPKGFYSATKYCAENLLTCYCQTFGMKYRILRMPNTLGIGDKHASKKKNALQYFVQEIVNNRPVELYWPDRTIRDYVHVDDVCRAINLVLTSGGTENEVFNVGNQIPIKFGDCVEYIVNKTGNNPVTHRERSDFHKVVQNNVMYLDNSKIVRLGYKPEHSVYQTLDELIEYYTKEMNG